LPGADKESFTETVKRVTETIPEIPEATEPHPHTMKLGEFIAHSHLFGRVKTSAWLKKGFSRVNEGTINDLVKEGVKKALFEKNVDALNEAEFKELFTKIQNLKLMAPSTKSVLSIGEESLAKSIKRVGAVDFFSVVSRKPTICDFKPVQVEVAIARLEDKQIEAESQVQVLRFANRVPLQFDKSSCAIVHALETVNWRAYGLVQPKNSIPQGPYIIAVSVVSPFIKFKNASKETIDASDELVEEIRRALIQAGQKLSKHIRHETKANELEQKIRHIEQFGPILVEALCRLTDANDARKKRAELGLLKLLGRDAKASQAELQEAEKVLEAHNKAQAKKEGEPISLPDAAVAAKVTAKVSGAKKSEKPAKKTKKSKLATEAEV
jgi:DNA topoisomerase-6 subunit B